MLRQPSMAVHELLTPRVRLKSRGRGGRAGRRWRQPAERGGGGRVAETWSLLRPPRGLQSLLWLALEWQGSSHRLTAVCRRTTAGRQATLPRVGSPRENVFDRLI